MNITDGVVAFAFGTPATIRPNLWIAETAFGRSLALGGAPVYTQRDILLADTVDVTYVDEVEGDPPPTLRIARGSVTWAQEGGIDTLWVAAANPVRYPHLIRCVRDLRHAIQEAGAYIRVEVCSRIYQYPRNRWYCPDSTQQRTRSERDWVSRERILQRVPMWLYKLVAS